MHWTRSFVAVSLRSQLSLPLSAHQYPGDQKKAALLDHISGLIVKASHIDSLREEHGVLRDRITQLERSTSLGQPARDTSRYVSADAYAALARKFNKLLENNREYQKAIEYLVEKCGTLKDRVREWEHYRAYKRRKEAEADRNAEGANPTEHPILSTPSAGLVSDRSEEKLSDRVPSSGFASSSRRAIISPALDPSYQLTDLKNMGLLEVGDSNHSVEELHQAQFDALEPLDARENRRTDLSTGVINEQDSSTTKAANADIRAISSQSTADETPAQNGPGQLTGPSDDQEEPIIISSRPVKHPRRRREHDPSDEFLQHQALPQQESTVNIKQESIANSSPPSTTSLKRPFLRTTTMDLDAPGFHLETPRKRTRYTKSSSRVESIRNNRIGAQDARSTSMPLPNESNGIAEADLREHVPIALTRSNSDPITGDEGAGASHALLARSGNTGSSQSTSDDSRVLLPVSPNRRILPRTSAASTDRKGRKDEARGAKIARLYAEVNDAPKRSHSLSTKSRSKSPGRQAESNKRLQNLLEDSTPQQRETIKALPTPRTDTSRRSKAEGRSTSPKRSVPRKKHTSGPQSRMDSVRHQSPVVKEESEVDIDPAYTRALRSSRQQRNDESVLRTRPLEDLTLDDFKLNPNYIGHHAALDVVRDRDTRRCLPGCTRPCCNTSFRAMVEAGARPELPSGIASSSPAGSQGSDTVELLNAEDRRLLHHHLGASYSREFVNGLSEEALQELLVQARTKLLSDRHGRHKRVWERAKSPPGFWRADMPNTQEEETDRDEAARMVRERVRERWEDARRGSGRWMFRDE